VILDGVGLSEGIFRNYDFAPTCNTWVESRGKGATVTCMEHVWAANWGKLLWTIACLNIIAIRMIEPQEFYHQIRTMNPVPFFYPGACISPWSVWAWTTPRGA
jgi:hypothetical protein